MKKFLSFAAVFTLPCVMFAQLTVGITTTNVSCNSVCDGTATASVSGGTPPYTYLWSPSGQVTAVSTNLCAGNYTVTVTDGVGGTGTATCVITQPSLLNVTGVANPSAICSGSNVAYMLTVTGGAAPYTFMWNFPGGSPSTSNMQNPVVSYSAAGMFNATCIVTDASGCVGSVTVTLTVNGGPTLTLTEIPATCNQSNGVLNATGASSYVWQPGNITSSTVTTATSNTTYTCTGTDFFGCTSSSTITVTDSCDYVWPGDANDDAVADNIDILDIGIANGATGTTRANATLTWIGQPSAPWGQTLLSGTDYKWVDCNGDGTISPVDTQAVVLNYGSIHSNRIMQQEFSSVGPNIGVILNQDSVGAGQTGTMSLFLGDATTPANNVYGVAFRLSYDATQISTPSFGMSGGATWFGTPGNDEMRVVLHPNPTMGYCDFAITRLDQQNVSGQGNIGTIYFDATNAMSGSGNATSVIFSLSNIVLVDASGAQLPVNASIGDTVEVCDPALLNSVTAHSTPSISVYPNPANENIQLNIPAGDAQLVTLEDVSGRIVYSQKHNVGLSSISVVALPAGVYFLRTSDQSGNTSTKKITIAH